MLAQGSGDFGSGDGERRESGHRVRVSMMFLGLSTFAVTDVILMSYQNTNEDEARYVPLTFRVGYKFPRGTF